MTSQSTPLYPRQTHNDDALIAGWLRVCAAMIFMMALIGAATRLTESGLSITEWRPITGTIPPLSAAAWQQAFELYRATPEYIQKNLGMTLAEFQTIFYWEWAHRLWGRVIGVVFIVPLVIFWGRRSLSPRLLWALLGLLILGGLQGFVGWFMVQSGLIDRPSVSHYRLAMHLSMALLIYSLVMATAWSVRPPASWAALPPARHSGLKIHAVIAMIFLAATIVWGAFVAGLDAGLIYNEFPTMGPGRLMPAEMWHQQPAWINLFENHAAVQFTHRALALLTVLIILALSAHALLLNIPGLIFPALAVMVFVQAGLGVAALLTNLHIVVAVAHQASALILLGLMVAVLSRLFYQPKAG